MQSGCWQAGTGCSISREGEQQTWSVLSRLHDFFVPVFLNVDVLFDDLFTRPVSDSNTQFFFCETFQLSEKITLTCFMGMFSEASCNVLHLTVCENP